MGKYSSTIIVAVFALLAVSETVEAHTADLSVDVSGPAQVGVSRGIDYRFNVNNGGPDDALGVILTVNLPSSTTYNSVTANGWRCTRLGAKVNCTIDLLPKGTPAATITIALISSSTPQRIRADAQIEGIASIEPNPYNNTGFAVTDVIGATSCSDQKPAHVAPAGSATNVNQSCPFSPGPR